MVHLNDAACGMHVRNVDAMYHVKHAILVMIKKLPIAPHMIPKFL